MFTNRQVNGYVYETRFIASWVREGGRLETFQDIGLFREWLNTLRIDEESVEHIIFLATNGKMELEHSAKVFLEQHR